MQITSVKIGGSLLIGQAVLNLRDEQTGIVCIDGSYEIKITFHSGRNPEQLDSKLSWNSDTTGVSIHAWAWENSLGESTTEPIKFATNNVNGKDISFMMVNRKLGVMNNCSFDIYEG